MTTRTRSGRPLTVWLLPVVFFALLAALFASAARADDDDDDDEEEIAYDVAEVYVELNDTDGDLGFHALIDGEPWDRLQLFTPNERRLLNVKVKGRLRRQGLTEFFFESAEPTFDELTPEQFFRRFPAGTYEVEGRTLDGLELEADVAFSHVLPGPPGGITVQGLATPGGCDEEDLPEVDPALPVVVAWDAVTDHHPEIGAAGPIDVASYQVVAEIDDTPFVFSTTLPGGTTAITLPADFMTLAEEYKLEILVRDANHNQVATETCFAVAAP